MRSYKGCLLCVILFIGILSGCIASTDQNPLNSLTIQQKYTILEDDEYWYYFDDGIYQISKDTGAKLLIDKVKATGANCIKDGWIYFVDTNWDICRVKTNGQDHAVLLNVKQFWEYEEQPIHGLSVVGNKLLIQLTFPLYCYDMESRAVTKISSDARTFEVMDNKVYYCGREGSIRVSDLQTEDSSMIVLGDLSNLEGSVYKNFVFLQDAMYYYMRHPDGLYCLLNNKSKLISDNSDINEFSLLVHDGNLYFVIRSNGGDYLMQYDPRKEKIFEILQCSDFIRGPKIVDENFYYLNSSSEIIEVKLPSA